LRVFGAAHPWLHALSPEKNFDLHLRELGWLDRSKEALSSQQSDVAKRAEKSAKIAVRLVHDQKQLGSVLKIMGQRLA
jgi:hypothetical protein